MIISFTITTTSHLYTPNMVTSKRKRKLTRWKNSVCLSCLWVNPSYFNKRLPTTTHQLGGIKHLGPIRFSFGYDSVLLSSPFSFIFNFWFARQLAKYQFRFLLSCSASLSSFPTFCVCICLWLIELHEKLIESEILFQPCFSYYRCTEEKFTSSFIYIASNNEEASTDVVYSN